MSTITAPARTIATAHTIADAAATAATPTTTSAG